MRQPWRWQGVGKVVIGASMLHRAMASDISSIDFIKWSSVSEGGTCENAPNVASFRRTRVGGFAARDIENRHAH